MPATDHRAGLPSVNPEDSTQNAWVQDWLTAYDARYGRTWADRENFERVTEAIQETYDYTRDTRAGRNR